MGSLGDLTPTDADDLVELFTFDFFGTTVRIHPDYAELTFLDFVEEASSVDESDPRAVLLVKNLMRALVHPDDFAAFWDTARRRRQSQKQLAELNNHVLAALAERPTSRPGDSSPGPTSTTPSSAAVSSLPGTARPAAQAAEDAATDRAIARLEAQGRPDLALVVDVAQGRRSA